jgi:hypothetical protein
MSAAEKQLLAARRARDEARTAYDTRLEQVKADLAARGVGSRLAHAVTEEATEALDVGLDVARERKGVLAGTFVAILLWLFKEPLVAALCAMGADSACDEDDTDHQEEPKREPVPEQA